MNVERFLPLKPRDYHVLFALSHAELHGYGLMKALEEQSGGLLRLDPTSLYRRLRVLLRDGLVAECDAGTEAPDADPRRRYYRITEAGMTVLRAEIRRMRGLVEDAEAARLVTET